MFSLGEAGRAYDTDSVGASFGVARGEHTLYVIGREDGTMLQAIKIVSGNATWGTAYCEYIMNIL